MTAAIDRVADAFLAIDTDNGQIADANPAAGAILGVARDALLGVDAMGFFPENVHADVWTELDAVTEGAESRHFVSSLRDRTGQLIPVDCTVSSFKTRGRVLALMLLRPI